MNQPKIIQLAPIKPGRYKLAKDWYFQCRPTIYRFDELEKSGCVKTIRDTVNPNNSVIIFPAGLVLSIDRYTQSWLYFSFYKKYNKGTGLPSFSYHLNLSNLNYDTMPYLEIP